MVLRKGWQPPAPEYHRFECNYGRDEDHPGPRCAHTLTAIAPTNNHGARLILFGGATGVEGQGGGATNLRMLKHCFYLLLVQVVFCFCFV